NCGHSTSFGKLLQYIDPVIDKEYMMEKFSDKFSGNSHLQVSQIRESDNFKPIKKRKFSEISLPSMKDLADGHHAKQYIKSRLIPEEFYDEIWYAEDFKLFIDDLVPGHKKELKENDPRIVFAFSDIDGNVVQVTGRSVVDRVRYISVKVVEGKKIFGMHRVRIDKRIYVTEGPIDSLFLPNAVASADANLEGLAGWLSNEYNDDELDIVLVFDREPRNKQLGNMIKEISKGSYKVCLLPNTFPGKDINEAVMNGCSIKNILRVIDTNTFCGIELAIEYMHWKAF
ncbi:MAG: hypothetical protein ACRDFB_10900, partial [Rhabdochlamydiaceae bacterium]